jgi:ribosome-associated protein
MSKRRPPKTLTDSIRAALEDAKAQDIVVLDVSQVSSFTDTMIVASGTSSRHVSAMASRLREALRERGAKPLGVEGEKTGDWVLMDYGDVVVHLMRPPIRDFYNLEKLWADAKPVKPEAPAKPKKPPRPRTGAPRKKKTRA